MAANKIVAAGVNFKMHFFVLLCNVGKKRKKMCFSSFFKNNDFVRNINVNTKYKGHASISAFAPLPPVPPSPVLHFLLLPLLLLLLLFAFVEARRLVLKQRVPLLSYALSLSLSLSVSLALSLSLCLSVCLSLTLCLCLLPSFVLSLVWLGIGLKLLP